jgi:N-acetylglucosaminyldiphosphoundecaprenol N-acetyl-beta-D-mannosaminyltransferase
MNNDSQGKRDRAQEIESVYKRFSRTSLLRLRIRRYIRSISWLFAISLAFLTKRALDLAISTILIFFLSPFLLMGWFLSGRSFNKTPRLGKWGVIFDELSFTPQNQLAERIIRFLHIARIPVLINILKGDMSVVGPLPASPGDLSLREKAVRRRYNVRPGLISLWWIRKRANIDYATELDVDMEYIQTHSALSDIGVCLRAIPAILYGQGVPTVPDQIEILGITINNLTMTEAIDTIVDWSASSGARQICFLNADCANIAYRNSTYLSVLNNASLCLADGVGLKLAGKLLGQDIAQNVNGTDMFPMLCKSLSERNVGLFLLGARAEVVEGVADWVHKNHPNLKLAGFHHGYFTPEEEPGIVEQIRDSGAGILLVAFGVPKQDLWIQHHLKELNVGVAMGVGGLFDFYSGRIPRAPLWMREIGMEWFFRFMQEPGRLWKRYFVGNTVFLSRVFREKLFGKK